jgi:hypothetical protein
MAGPPPASAFEEAGSVVHLAGEPIVARRWSQQQKKLIRDSRVVSTRNLVEGLRRLSAKPASLICGSAVGFYGDRGDELLDERSAGGSGFLTDVCKEWEAEAERAAELSVRVVRLRTGVVLSTEGGALRKMLPAFKAGVAGPLGGGRQWVAWIHIDDIVGIICHAIATTTLAGPVNGTAPEPVTNAEFTKELAAAVHRPAFVPAPAFGLRLVMGEMAEVLLASQRVIPREALDSGYQFKYPTLTGALQSLFGSTRIDPSRLEP